MNSRGQEYIDHVNKCDRCEGVADNPYRVDDEMLCADCFDEAVSRAEYAYEAYREAEVTGN